MCVCHLEMGGDVEMGREQEKVFHELGPPLEMFLLESYETLS